MSYKAAISVGVATLLIAAGVLVWAFFFQPKSITGDPNADKACTTLAERMIGNGDEKDALRRMLDDTQRAEIARDIQQHSNRAAISSIRDAGAQFPESGGFFSLPEFMTAVGDLGQACQAAGWTHEKAGIDIG